MRAIRATSSAQSRHCDEDLRSGGLGCGKSNLEARRSTAFFGESLNQLNVGWIIDAVAFAEYHDELAAAVAQRIHRAKYA